MDKSIKQKKPLYKRIWVWVIAIIILIGVATSGGESEESKATQSTTSNSTATDTIKTETKINYDNFSNIKMGSKYDDVKALIGEGSELSSSEISGIKTAIYSWNGEGISNMNVTIQNGAVIGKAQIGLYEGNADVTLAKYNQIKEGSKYDQVKAILGEGEVTSVSKIGDIESTMYSWMNKDGSNITVTFSGGKMQLKAQFNLK